MLKSSWIADDIKRQQLARKPEVPPEELKGDAACLGNRKSFRKARRLASAGGGVVFFATASWKKGVLTVGRRVASVLLHWVW